MKITFDQLKKSKITVAYSDEGGWSALYINDKLYEQDHSIDFESLFRELFPQMEYRQVDEEWAADNGHFPNKLKDVKWENDEEA